MNLLWPLTTRATKWPFQGTKSYISLNKNRTESVNECAIISHRLLCRGRPWPDPITKHNKTCAYSMGYTLCMIMPRETVISLGWGLLRKFSPFRYYLDFSSLSKHTLEIEYHVYILQISLQHSCGDTCQIWMWFRESNRYFCKIENFTHAEINERDFSTPSPDDICTRAGKNMLCNQKISYAITRLVVKTWHAIICNMLSGSWLVHYMLKHCDPCMK